MRSVVLAALVGMLLAGPAAADCGWVLWKQWSKTMPGKNWLGYWSLLEGAESRRECETRAMAWTKNLATTAASPEVEVVVKGTQVTIYSGEGRKWLDLSEFVCLPAAADPRPRYSEKE